MSIVGAEIFLFCVGVYYKINILGIVIILIIFNMWHIDTKLTIYSYIKRDKLNYSMIRIVSFALHFLFLSFCIFRLLKN